MGRPGGPGGRQGQRLKGLSGCQQDGHHLRKTEAEESNTCGQESLS